MKRLFPILAIILSFFISSLPTKAEEQQAAPFAYVIQVKGVISPASHDLIRRHLVQAAEQKADVVVLQMHTPGGLYDSMQQIIQNILDSSVPVVTYVSPAGSHAASAGTFILYASHIAAMAPGTNIGAATPVNLQDTDKPADKTDATMPKKGEPKTPMEHKMVNDASAYIRGLAELRGRNVEWAEKAVRAAESLTASEALSKKVIDFIAEDLPSLLNKIDGKQVKMKDGTTKTLKTKGARTETVEPDWRTKILGIITHPNVAFLLMTLGSYGLIYEFAHPGALFPGIVGGICLLLGLYALNILPISYAGAALLFAGIALMAAEAFVPAFGVLGIGGAVAFALGATFLIDSDMPGYGIDLWLIAAMTVSSLGILSVLLTLALKSQKRPGTTGVEELLLATAQVLHWSKGRGEVMVTGEVWQAEADENYIFKKGDSARIIKVDGLRVTIAPHK